MCEDHAAALPARAERLRARAEGGHPLRCRRTILLIEDDTEMRRLLACVLARDGYEVVAVADGDEALDWLGLCLFDGSLRNVPALIVSDVRLPHFSGLELLEGLLCANAEVPVVLITGFPSEQTYAEAFELGAARVLAKPFDLDTLRLAVQNVLGVPGWTKLRA